MTTNYTYSREEQETYIHTDATRHDWTFWTFDPKFVRRVEKLGYQFKKDHQGGLSCVIPLDRISIRRPEKRKLNKRQRQNILQAHLSRKSVTAGNEISDQGPKLND